MIKVRFGILLRVCLLAGLLVGCSEEPAELPPETDSRLLKTGFFSPGHVDRYAPYVQNSIINVSPVRLPDGDIIIDTAHLEDMFKYIDGLEHRINLDLGLVITDSMAQEDIKLTYTKRDGSKANKSFTPLPANKLKKLVSNDELQRRVKGLAPLIKKYREHVGFVLVLDEPYLNGVPPEDIDRVIVKLKEIFAGSGVQDLEYGVVFASALFNAKFAKFINQKKLAYVEALDTYYNGHKHLLGKDTVKANNFHRWLKSMQKFRLTTYDSANNMHLEGGLPKEVDLVGFNFYLSTLLFDLIHADTLDYFNGIGMPGCANFEGVPIKEIWRDLSFFQDGPVVDDPAAMTLDRQLLNDIFRCRMASAMNLLTAESQQAGHFPKIFMIAESSANGLLEFDSSGKVEQGQPELLVEKRIYEEVHRSYLFYLDNRSAFKAGLYFFLYPDSFDWAINLRISGAEGAPSVLNYIYSFSRPATDDLDTARRWVSYDRWAESRNR